MYSPDVAISALPYYFSGIVSRPKTAYNSVYAHQHPLSRRDFLKIGLLALGSLAAGPGGFIPPLPDGEKLPVGMARVATAEVALYQEPDLRSKRIGRLLRDQVIDLWEVVRSPAGPSRNPVWYRLDEGWVHSALLQRVDQQHLNPIPSRLESELVPAVITVPVSYSMRIDRNKNWIPAYRLYYQSLHWVTGIRPGPDGAPWAELKDERLLVKYCVPAEHVRLLKMEEYMPLSVGLPLDAKLIEVYIGEQMLRAYEEGKLVREVRISSGLPQYGESPNGILTDTPIGSFYVTSQVARAPHGLRLPDQRPGRLRAAGRALEYVLP